MSIDLQKASMWKRISAFLFDFILLATLAVAVAFLLSAVLDYDGYNDSLSAGYARYENEYSVNFSISSSEYDALTDEQRQLYQDAYDAMIADEQVLSDYNMVMNLTLVILTLAVLLSTMLLEFVVPLLLHNGQTLGKKIFGVGLMRTDGVQLTTVQLLIRSLLGKFTIETMIPIYILMMIFMGTIGIVGPTVLLGIALIELISLAATRTNSAIHDLLAGTVAVDLASQQIFRSTDDLIAYTQKRAAEEAARKPY